MDNSLMQIRILSIDIIHIPKVRGLERNTPNIYLTYQTINIIQNRNPVNQLQYSRPDLDYYGTPSRRSQTQPRNPMVITLHPQTQQMFSAGMHMEEESALFSMDIDFSVKRLDQLKAGKPERDDKTTSSE